MELIPVRKGEARADGGVVEVTNKKDSTKSHRIADCAIVIYSQVFVNSSDASDLPNLPSQVRQ